MFASSLLNVNSVVDAEKTETMWYRIYADGFIQQGGFTTTKSAGATINLPYAMPDGNYSCVVTKMATSSEHSIGVPTRTATSFSYTIRGTNGASNQPATISWLVEGFLK